MEAWIQNKDIGFVKEGQIAEVKIEAFPFTKYSTIDAAIILRRYRLAADCNAFNNEPLC